MTGYFLLVCALLSVSLKAERSFKGHTTVSNETMADLEVFGKLTLANLTVTKTVSVSGRCEGNGLVCQTLSVQGLCCANDVKAETLSVRGKCEGEGYEISGNAAFRGAFDVKNSTFGSMTLALGKGRLSGCVVKGPVKISKPSSNSDNKEEILHLAGKTVVEGDVVFESGTGTLMIDRDARVLGTVSGAKIHQAS